MKKRPNKEELARIRKREQSRKEMEFELGRDLNLKDQQQETEERFYANKNRFIIAGINFFGTLTILFIPYMIANKVISLGVVSNPIMVLIIRISILSAFRKRSIIENWFS